MIDYVKWLESELKRMEYEIERFRLKVKFHPELFR